MPKSKGRRKPKRTRPTPPPPPKQDKTSPVWYVALMFSLMGIGVLIVVLNYIGIFGDFDRRYLFGGLGAIAVGFMMTLGYR
jgi:hypothetical protein